MNSMQARLRAEQEAGRAALARRATTQAGMPVPAPMAAAPEPVAPEVPAEPPAAAGTPVPTLEGLEAMSMADLRELGEPHGINGRSKVEIVGELAAHFGLAAGEKGQTEEEPAPVIRDYKAGEQIDIDDLLG